MGLALSIPWARQVNVRAAETMSARWTATLQQNCLWTMVSTSYWLLMSKNVPLLVFPESLKKKEKALIAGGPQAQVAKLH